MKSELLFEDINSELLNGLVDAYFDEQDTYNFQVFKAPGEDYNTLASFFINTTSEFYLPKKLPWNFFVDESSNRIEKEWIVCIIAVERKYFQIRKNLNSKLPFLYQQTLFKEFPNKINIPWNFFYFLEIPLNMEKFFYFRSICINQKLEPHTIFYLSNESIKKACNS